MKFFKLINKNLLFIIMLTFMLTIILINDSPSNDYYKKSSNKSKKFTYADTLNKGNTQIENEEDMVNDSGALFIQGYNKQGNCITMGCGIACTKDGKIFTTLSTVDKVDKAFACDAKGNKYPIQGVVDYNKEKNIALLKLENSNFEKVSSLGDSNNLNIGDRIYSIYYTSNSIVSRISGNIQERDLKNKKVFKISFPTNDCTGGGGLYDAYGRLSGIILPADEIYKSYNYVIPINDIKYMLSKNKVKNFSEFYDKLYPKISLDKLQKLIKNNYCSYSAGGKKLYIDDVKISQGKDSSELYIDLIVHNKSYTLIKDTLDDKTLGADYDQGIIENMIAKIGDNISIYYPNSEIYCKLSHTGEYKDKPKEFKNNEIDYLKDKKVWYVNHKIVFSYNTDGSFKFEWPES